MRQKCINLLPNHFTKVIIKFETKKRNSHDNLNNCLDGSKVDGPWAPRLGVILDGPKGDPKGQKF